MKDFKPNTPYNVAAELQSPKGGTVTVKGVPVKKYEKIDVIYISFRTFGGTEKTSNGVIAIEDTGIVETWYRPDIKSDCRLVINGVPYEILGTPENINNRCMWMVFKVRAVKGGA